ncbi:MAG: L,D-transpeptidase [Chloroflexi bacterium]|nr:L,D-transpeptidase [Chloroflexota bacterium]MCY3582464.1 L,D-transpeptidase [Chloroflexota bacterium]MCY3717381.1 L,D-transpeptidase [Chloroflexota bacterium]MDE2651121.1 L,D-transpeptidase [Chloroflexota bacterium]MXV92138.1 L,D-transpeptidase [Chloroflexota bacterium]
MTRRWISLMVVALIVLAGMPAQARDMQLGYDPSPCAAQAPGLAPAVAAANSRACLELMTAFPRPALERAPLDAYSLNIYSFWRVKSAAGLYTTPGGELVGQVADGFNYVRARDASLPNWIQATHGNWLRHEDVELAQPSFLRGFVLPADWRLPFAIILDKTGIYASLEPGGARSPASGFVTRRYELVNIFAQAEDGDGHVWYLVGPRRWLRQEFVAKFAPIEKPPDIGGRWLAVDLFEQTLIAYEDAAPVFATIISSGMKNWSTREGSFTIWARLENDSMRGATGAPEAYALEQVPWVMYFDGDISLHGSYWHDDFGYRRSHGCVNLSISDARWLYEWTAQGTPDAAGEALNHVLVYSSGVYADG